MGSCKKQYLFWMIPGCVWIFTLKFISWSPVSDDVLPTCSFTAGGGAEVQCGGLSSIWWWSCRLQPRERLLFCPAAPLSQVWDPELMSLKMISCKVSAVLHSPAHCAVIGSDMFIYVKLFYLYPQTRCNFIQRFRLNYICGWLLGLNESFVLFSFFFFAGHLKMFPDRRRTESAKLFVIFLNLKTGTKTINMMSYRGWPPEGSDLTWSLFSQSQHCGAELRDAGFF